MRRATVILIALAALAPTAAAVAQTSPWSSGTYLYDGAGNISAIGTDYYVYDAVGRLTRGSADKQRSGADSYQTYTYDKYGNRLTVSTTGMTCAGGCGVNLDVNDFNHIKTTSHGASYDGAGNLTQFDGFQYTYDAVQLMSRMRLPNTAVDSQYIYTADDERLATFTGSNHWQFTVRDLDGKILREVTATEGAPTSWSWDRDHVFRDGQLLATVLPSSVVQHYHLDHLGSPRLVTGNGGVKLGVHAYYPFGDELSLGLGEAATERLKFTGHERDDNGGYGNALDYMHARYYGAEMGRFLSIDPKYDDDVQFRPQKWNRYVYSLNNPGRYVDPDGRTIYDFIEGIGNGWSSSNLGNINRVRPRNVDYKRGQMVGDAIAIASGAYETIIGGNLILGGGAAELVTAGGGTVAAVPAAAVGAIAVTHGLATGANALNNLSEANRGSSGESAEPEVDVSKLKRLSDRDIRDLGGEELTRELKAYTGKSKANLYLDRETGRIYSVTKGGEPQWVHTIESR